MVPVSSIFLQENRFKPAKQRAFFCLQLPKFGVNSGAEHIYVQSSCGNFILSRARFFSMYRHVDAAARDQLVRPMLYTH